MQFGAGGKGDREDQEAPEGEQESTESKSKFNHMWLSGCATVTPGDGIGDGIMLMVLLCDVVYSRTRILG